MSGGEREGRGGESCSRERKGAAKGSGAGRRAVVPRRRKASLCSGHDGREAGREARAGPQSRAGLAKVLVFFSSKLFLSSFVSEVKL